MCNSVFTLKGFCILITAIIPSLPATVAVSSDVGSAQSPERITIVVCGDSTVATNNDPNKPGAGWGQMLAQHFTEKVTVINLASGGQSSKTFLTQEHKFKKAIELKPDFMFIQFGHNDGPGKGPERETDPNTTYSDNLRTMIEQARAIGARCVLVTPMERRGFDKNGKIKTDLLGPYSAAVKRVGKEKGVFVIDLHDKSVEIYEKLGREEAQKQFSPDGKDGTHFNKAGAQLWAEIICQELRNAGPEYEPLKKALKTASASDSETFQKEVTVKP